MLQGISKCCPYIVDSLGFPIVTSDHVWGAVRHMLCQSGPREGAWIAFSVGPVNLLVWGNPLLAALGALGVSEAQSNLAAVICLLW